MKSLILVTLIGLIGCSSTAVRSSIDEKKPHEGIYTVKYHPDSGYVLTENVPQLIVRTDTVKVFKQPKNIVGEAFHSSNACADKRQEMIGNEWVCTPCRGSVIKNFDQVCDTRIFGTSRCANPNVALMVCYKE